MQEIGHPPLRILTDRLRKSFDKGSGPHSSARHPESRVVRMFQSGFLVALLVAILSTQEVFAEGQVDESDFFTASLLFRATPEEGDELLRLSCNRWSNTLTVWIAIGPIKDEDHDALPIELVFDKGTIPLTGKVSDRSSIQAKIAFPPRAEKLLNNTNTIGVKVAGRDYFGTTLNQSGLARKIHSGVADIA